MKEIPTVTLLARQQDLLRELMEIGRELTQRQLGPTEPPVPSIVKWAMAPEPDPAPAVTQALMPDEDPYCKKGG